MKRVVSLGRPRPRTSPHPVARLLREVPFRIARATVIRDTTVLTLADPCPPDGPLVRNAFVVEARRLARQRPGAEPITTIKVWAPTSPTAAPEVVRIMHLDHPLGIASSSDGDGAGGVRRYLIPFNGRERAISLSMARHPSVAGDPALRRTLFIPQVLRERFDVRHLNGSTPFADFAQALLEEAGFTVRVSEKRDGIADIEALIGRARVFVRSYSSRDCVRPSAVDAFVHRFILGRFTEGVFLTDGRIPFGVRHWERDRDIYLIGRLRLQRLVNATAARLIRNSPMRSLQ